jgi:non-ribosomal peptide synthetase component E (peptide arylation enzyme)
MPPRREIIETTTQGKPISPCQEFRVFDVAVEVTERLGTEELVAVVEVGEESVSCTLSNTDVA